MLGDKLTFLGWSKYSYEFEAIASSTGHCLKPIKTACNFIGPFDFFCKISENELYSVRE